MLSLRLALTVALLAALGGCQAATILLQTLPGGMSHHMVGLALSRALTNRNHTVHMVLADYDHAALAAKGLLDPSVVGAPVVFPTAPNSHEEFEALLSELQARPREMIALHFGHFEQQCRYMLRDPAAMVAVRRLNADLAIVDGANPCAAVIAELLQLPRVELSVTDLVEPFASTALGIPYTPAVHGFTGSGLASPMAFLERAANTLLSPLVVRYGVSVAGASHRRLAQEFKLTEYRSLKEAHRSTRMLLVNAAVGVATPRSLPPHVKMVGPLLLSGARQPLPAELDSIVRQAGELGVVYASTGTVFKLQDCKAARGLAAALSSLNRTVIWNVGASHFAGECPLDSLGLPPSVHTVPWVPQADLLAHPAVKVLVTNGGLASTHEAVYFDTPLVCLPQGTDHFDNCAKAVKGGWGLHFKTTELSVLTAPQLAALIERAASEASFAKNAARTGGMLRAHPRPPAEQAADWVEYALALPPDANLRDPAAAMPWWQWLCLDVYAAVALLAAVLLAGLWGTGRAAWRAARPGRAAPPAAKQKAT